MIRREEIDAVANLLKVPTSAVPDRSEIGPYLGESFWEGLRTTFGGLPEPEPGTTDPTAIVPA